MNRPMKKKPANPASPPQVKDLPNPGVVPLRERAEAQLPRRPAKTAGLTTKVEMARLVHELEVHQVELEMQNAELQQTRNEAEALLAQYTDLYDFAPTGYFNFGRDGTILAVNLTGARFLGVERAQLLHRRFGSLVSEASRPTFNAFLDKTFAGTAREFCEVRILDTGSFPLFVRIEGVVSEDRKACRAAVLDITDRHRAEVDRERLIQELQTALTRVKTLSGLLPICASCKRIRDDQGYWNQVESYIRSHSEATFTHSICPDCRQKLYPELGAPGPSPTARRTPGDKRPSGQP
jgi:PAS domain S-box-containing protein